MKKAIACLFFAFITSVNVGLFIVFTECLHVSKTIETQAPTDCGIDFRSRYNEITVLRKGINPFFVWDGTVSLPPYYPMEKTEQHSDLFQEPINAYPPWEYIFMMPLTFIPRAIAWPIWYGVMFVSLYAIAFFAFVRGRAIKGDVFDGLLAAGVAQMISFPIYFDVHCGNFPLVIAGVMAIMVWALNRHHDIIAGLCLSFAMIKPQMSILLVIPLLLHRRFKTVIIGAVVCLAFALIAATMCHTNVVELIFQGPRASAFAFQGNAIFPGFLLRGHEILAPFAIGLGLVFGVLVACWISWQMRKESDWLLLLAPMAVISVSWTYAQMYNFAIVWMLMLVLILSAMRERTMRTTVFSFISIAILAGITCVIGKSVDVFCCGGWQSVKFLTLGSDLLRTLVAAVAIIWCWQLKKQKA